jgi:uncharacterized repeat protein (TIGR03803 family)
MNNNASRVSTLALAALVATLSLTTTAFAQYAENMLLYFSGNNYGSYPGALLRDSAGNFYVPVQTVPNKGCDDGQSCGAIIKVSPNTSGHYTENIIHTFAPGAGGDTTSSILMDAHGDIFGATNYGGITRSGCRYGCGVVFELKPLSAGGYAFSLLYSFADSTDGLQPILTLIDASGNLYGESRGGAHGQGQIFEISNSGGTWTKSVLYTFKGSSTDWPAVPQFIDASGNIYASASGGGTVTTVCIDGCGQVVEFSPAGSSWTKTVLYSFAGQPDGTGPSTLIPDGSGNIWGITAAGGSGMANMCVNFHGCGTLFELTPNSSGGWNEVQQHSFDWNLDGWLPFTMVYDGAGNFYVDMYEGTVGQYGGVLKFSLASDGIWMYNVLHSFANDKGGGLPAFLALDPSGNVYGTVIESGGYKAGGIYELSPP